MSRIMVVDDDSGVRALLRSQLEKAGYEVVMASNGKQALEIQRMAPVELIVLDIVMPGLSGFEVTTELRALGFATPIILLTALGSQSDIVRGLDAGADDYLTKPFQFRELNARIGAIMRRHRNGQTVLRFEDVQMDRVSRVVLRGDQVIKLTRVEFRLLQALMLRAGQPISRENLYDQVWGITFHPGTNVLNTHISRLRAKLEAGGRGRLIHVVRGFGYRLRGTRKTNPPWQGNESGSGFASSATRSISSPDISSEILTARQDANL